MIGIEVIGSGSQFICQQIGILKFVRCCQAHRVSCSILSVGTSILKFGRFVRIVYRIYDILLSRLFLGDTLFELSADNQFEVESVKEIESLNHIFSIVILHLPLSMLSYCQNKDDYDMKKFL